jgi:hypothetical protein
MVTQNSRGTCQPCRLIYLGVAGVLVTGSVMTGRRGGFSVFRDSPWCLGTTGILPLQLVHRLPDWV